MDQSPGDMKTKMVHLKRRPSELTASYAESTDTSTRKATRENMNTKLVRVQLLSLACLVVIISIRLLAHVHILSFLGNPCDPNKKDQEEQEEEEDLPDGPSRPQQIAGVLNARPRPVQRRPVAIQGGQIPQHFQQPQYSIS